MKKRKKGFSWRRCYHRKIKWEAVVLYLSSGNRFTISTGDVLYCASASRLFGVEKSEPQETAVNGKRFCVESFLCFQGSEIIFRDCCQDCSLNLKQTKAAIASLTKLGWSESAAMMFCARNREPRRHRQRFCRSRDTCFFRDHTCERHAVVPHRSCMATSECQRPTPAHSTGTVTRSNNASF